MNYILLNREELPRDGNAYELQGFQYLDSEVSVIWVDMPLSGEIRLHKQPYKKNFIVQEGVAAFIVGASTIETHAGQVIISCILSVDCVKLTNT